jgi:hypothetical protein
MIVTLSKKEMTVWSLLYLPLAVEFCSGSVKLPFDAPYRMKCKISSPVFFYLQADFDGIYRAYVIYLNNSSKEIVFCVIAWVFNHYLS